MQQRHEFLARKQRFCQELRQSFTSHRQIDVGHNNMEPLDDFHERETRQNDKPIADEKEKGFFSSIQEILLSPVSSPRTVVEKNVEEMLVIFQDEYSAVYSTLSFRVQGWSYFLYKDDCVASP